MSAISAHGQARHRRGPFITLPLTGKRTMSTSISGRPAASFRVRRISKRSGGTVEKVRICGFGCLSVDFSNSTYNILCHFLREIQYIALFQRPPGDRLPDERLQRLCEALRT